GSNAPSSPAAGRSANTSWPNQRTAWWPASSNASRRPRWPSGPRLGEEYQRHQRQRPARLSAAELAAIRTLAADIPAPWAPPTTTAAAPKRLRPRLIESVHAPADGATERVQATVTWAGGHQTHAALTRPVALIDQLSYYPALTARIQALADQALPNAAIADRLAAEGFRTPRQCQPVPALSGLLPPPP